MTHHLNMTIESDEGVVDLQATETEETETNESTEEKPEEKPKETPEQRVARLKRQLEREEKKLGVRKEEQHIDKETRSGELDYGEKAFLRSYDIKGSDELALVKDWQKRTGDALDSIVEDDIFQAKLTKLREARAAAEAIPRSTKRTAQVATDDASYWQSKIESGQASLADIQDIRVRREVLNRRIEQEKTGGRFSDNPIQIT